MSCKWQISFALLASDSFLVILNSIISRDHVVIMPVQDDRPWEKAPVLIFHLSSVDWKLTGRGKMVNAMKIINRTKGSTGF